MKRTYSTGVPTKSNKSSNLYIKSLSKFKNKLLEEVGSLEPSSFGTVDIETINFNGIQTPIAISCVNKGIKKLFIIDIHLFRNNSELAIDKMFKNYIEYIQNLHCVKFGNYTIFAHNLGSFDGYFIHKALSKYSDLVNNSVETLLDNQNKFIMNKLNFKVKYKVGETENEVSRSITFKDSYRIFPVSLTELCKVFGLEGKISKYNLAFNSIDMFNNPELLAAFKKYSLQDSVCLYNALHKAQHIYCNSYFVDITDIFSTASLSLKIFRMNFMNEDTKIPILKDSLDSFIRKSYLGGATDYYKKYGKNLKIYDVNSLYPHVMLKDMPFELINSYEDMSEIKLENFFGFVLAKIKVSKDIVIPLLPYKDPKSDKTIFPTGEWTGVYFSEELKAVVKHGYEVTLIKGYEFSKINLFNDYINHFYDKKATSTGAERFISKMHLNQLYGVFGRKQEVFTAINVTNEEFEKYLATHIIRTVIDLGNIKTILFASNIATHILEGLNSTYNSTIQSPHFNIKSNVAIASAVTSYARMEMIYYKTLLGNHLYYTDTDSIYTDLTLKPYLVNNLLGFMKDELDGGVINEAYFLGIKKYGYTYTDSEGNLLNKSVIAGYERNGLTFDEIISIAEGNSITKVLDTTRFEKSISKLEITTIDQPKLTISNFCDKELIDNKYIPPHLTNLLTYLARALALVLLILEALLLTYPTLITECMKN